MPRDLPERAPPPDPSRTLKPAVNPEPDSERPISVRPPRPESSGRSAEWRARAAMAAALGLPAVLYLLTLYPGVGGRINTGDSAKFQYIGEILGVPHQPGYPLYVLLNFLFTRLPLPLDLATKVNLLSAVLALAAGWLLYLLAFDLGTSRWAAVAATWALLLSPVVWIYATEAEVYALHLLLVVAVCWLANRWLEGREPVVLGALLLVLALAFAHHTTIVTLVPAVAWAVWRGGWRTLVSRPVVTAAVLGAVVTAALYGFVLYRSHSDAAFVEGIDRGAEITDLVDTVSGTRFTEKNLMRKGPGELVARLGALPLEAGRQLSWATVVLALAGAGWIGRKRSARAFLLLAAGVSVALLAVYHIGDWKSYLPPIWALTVLLAVLGVERVRSGWPRRLALALWTAVIGVGAVSTCGEVAVASNPYDREMLIEMAGNDAVVAAYRGPGYKARQLGKYHEIGRHLGRDRGLLFRSAGVIFEQQYQFLEEWPIYFSKEPVRRMFAEHHVDFEDLVHPTRPQVVYSRTGSVWPIGEIRIEPAGAGEVVVRDDRNLTLIDAQDEAPIRIAAIDRTGLRVRGVGFFDYSDVLESLKQPGVASFLIKIADDDMIVAVARVPQSRADHERFVRLAEFLLHPLESPQDAIGRSHYVVAGVKRTLDREGIAVFDPETPIALDVVPMDGDASEELGVLDGGTEEAPDAGN